MNRAGGAGRSRGGGTEGEKWGENPKQTPQYGQSPLGLHLTLRS